MYRNQIISGKFSVTRCNYVHKNKIKQQRN